MVPSVAGIGGQVGAGQVGVAGEGGALLAVHQKAHLGDVGKVGVQGAADGEHGEGFRLDAGRMAGGEAAGEVESTSQLRSDARVLTGSRKWDLFVARGTPSGEQEDLSHGGCAPPGTGWAAVGQGVEVEEFTEHRTGAGTGVQRQRKGADLGEQRAVTVIGDDQSGLLGGRDSGAWVGADSWPARRRWWARSRKFQSTTAITTEANKRDEEKFLVAGNHGRRASVRSHSSSGGQRAGKRAW